MQPKHADNTYSKINEPLTNHTDIFILPGKQTVIHIKSEVHTENEVTGKSQPFPDQDNNDDPIIRPALRTTQKAKHCTHPKLVSASIYLGKGVPPCFILNPNTREGELYETSQTNTIAPSF